MSATGKWFLAFLFVATPLAQSQSQLQDLSSARARLAQELTKSKYTFVVQLHEFERVLLSLGYQKVETSLDIVPVSDDVEGRDCMNGGEKFEGEACARTSYTFAAKYKKESVVREVSGVGELWVTAQSLKFINFYPPRAIELE